MSFVNLDNLDSPYSVFTSPYNTASTAASGSTASTADATTATTEDASTENTTSTSSSPAATVSISTDQALGRDLAQLFQDIQSGSVTNAQKDMTALNQLGASQIFGADSSTGELLANVQKSLGSGDISGAQSALQSYLSSGVEQIVSANSEGVSTSGGSTAEQSASVSAGSTTDQSASGSIVTPEGTLNVTTSSLTPTSVAFFQLVGDTAHGDTNDGLAAYNALSTDLTNSGTSPTGSSQQVFQALGQALESGDSSEAQQELNQFLSETSAEELNSLWGH
jgi:hypothetical protein